MYFFFHQCSWIHLFRSKCDFFFMSVSMYVCSAMYMFVCLYAWLYIGLSLFMLGCLSVCLLSCLSFFCMLAWITFFLSECFFTGLHCLVFKFSVSLWQAPVMHSFLYWPIWCMLPICKNMLKLYHCHKKVFKNRFQVWSKLNKYFN